HSDNALDIFAIHTERRVARHRVGRCDTEVLESAAGLDPGKPVFDSLDDSGAVDDDIPLAAPRLVSVRVHTLETAFASSVQATGVRVDNRDTCATRSWGELRH